MNLSLQTLLIMAAAGGLVVALGIVVHSRPRFGMIVWVCSIVFVPVWIGVGPLTPSSAVAIFVLIAAAPGLPRVLGLSDFLVAAFFLGSLIAVLLGDGSLTSVVGIYSVWGVGYLFGRIMPIRVEISFIYVTVAVLFSIIAILAILESLADWNPFLSLGGYNALKGLWGTIQFRGDVPRAEGAFGHSIALGSSLALAIPLTLGCRLPLWSRLTMAALMLAAIVVTISRISLVCACLAVILTIVFDRDITSRMRIGLSAAFLVLAAALSPYLLEALAAAGDEASRSADYRGSLFTLVPNMVALGVSPVAQRSAGGQLSYGTFQSIDSQLILTGLSYGWLPLLFGIAALIGGLIWILRGKATPPVIAVIAQIPALATVALITQYSSFFWFVAGLAATSLLSKEERWDEFDVNPDCSQTRG